jgi:hypothetical protein
MSIWKEFLNFIHGVGHEVLNFISPLAASIARNGGPVLLEIAQAAVLAAETTGGSGSDKLKAAQEAVVAGLKAKEIPIVMNAVNGAIEAAVAALQAKVSE